MNTQTQRHGNPQRSRTRARRPRRWLAAGVTAIAGLLLTLAPAAFGQPCGDCDFNGEINILDSLLAAQHAQGLATIPGPRILNCDVDASGAVTQNDAQLIAEVAAGLPTPLNCLACGDCSSFGGINPGLEFSDYNFALDHFLGTGIFGTPLLDAAFAACDTDGDGAITPLPDLLTLYAATYPGAPVPAPAPVCIGCGDCNQDGVVDALDAETMAEVAVDLITVGPRGTLACDVNGSGTVTILDALILLLTLPAAPTCTNPALPSPLPTVTGAGFYTVVGPPDGTPWTFLAIDTVTGVVWPGGPVSVSPPGTATDLANAWVTAINGLPGGNFFAAVTSVGSGSATFVVFAAGGGAGALAVENPLCIPTLGGNPCSFNGLLVATDPDGATPPVAMADHFETVAGVPYTISVLGNDFDVEGNLDPASAEVAEGPSHGQVFAGPKGTFVYLPEDGFEGEDSFYYRVCDTGGGCDIAEVTAAVRSRNNDDGR